MIIKSILRVYNSWLRRLAGKVAKFNPSIRIPVFGMGCGVLGLALAKVQPNLGQYAAQLLRALEYRGFDSTGAAFQAEGEDIVLLKDVGAPSTLVKTLGIERQGGQIFCGQVRWATFGAVNKENAQPHEVRCKRHLYGAHNGNITNTRELKAFLTKEGHTVVSDNDGEIVVHTVEHYFDIELEKAEEPDNHDEIKACMRRAIVSAGQDLVGSFAAVIVHPETRTLWAIKSGSSLYFGVGELDGGKFALASSDLTAVLKFTKMLVNLREGEFVEYNADYFRVYAGKDLCFKHFNQKDEEYAKGDKIPTQAVYSRLRAEDVQLLPQYEFFMEQEIFAEVESTGKLVKLFSGGSNTGKRMYKLLESNDLIHALEELTSKLMQAEDPVSRKKVFDEYHASPQWQDFFPICQKDFPEIFDVALKQDFDKKYFFSNEKNVFIELVGDDYELSRIALAKALDSVCELKSVAEFESEVLKFLELIKETMQHQRRAYTIACGTSFHATKVASLFFNEIAGFEIIPILPGDFRGEYSNCLKDHDLIIGVSQSGETKDLIDIFNDIDASGLDVSKVVLVNNMNSTLGQEKSDVAIPILCGPEIAVPATKSFMNQITLLYYLAIRTAKMILEETDNGWSKKEKSEKQNQLEARFKNLAYIPELIKETVTNTADIIDAVAAKIYMEPSLHILATKITGVAMEGALKIRETVLNHAEGKEASEFKHGPNTILGKNTVFGLKHVRNYSKTFTDALDDVGAQCTEHKVDRKEMIEIVRALSAWIFTAAKPFNLSAEGYKIFNNVIREKDFIEPMYRNYPLIYVTGPSERDVNLTISQINTHKIRGADTYVIAEENDNLLKYASEKPDKDRYYGWNYIFLPKTNDSLLTCFSATVVLQLLALKMSIRKMRKLDRLGIADHGVHPDVPKNVSKSITVD